MVAFMCLGVIWNVCHLPLSLLASSLVNKMFATLLLLYAGRGEYDFSKLMSSNCIEEPTQTKICHLMIYQLCQCVNIHTFYNKQIKFVYEIIYIQVLYIKIYFTVYLFQCYYIPVLRKHQQIILPAKPWLQIFVLPYEIISKYTTLSFCFQHVNCLLTSLTTLPKWCRRLGPCWKR